ncbi:MAG: Holliday junction resolvase RuvX [Candidatus Cloacimonadaceae bacterium]
MPGRLLAIDYGEMRIGLALSDPMRMFAKPLMTLDNTSLDQTVSVLNDIIREKEIARIIVGIPWSLDGNATDKTRETQQFFTELQQRIDIEVVGMDERFTTSDANELLKEMGYDWKQARKVIDAMAACLILKRYLETHPDEA